MPTITSKSESDLFHYSQSSDKNQADDDDDRHKKAAGTSGAAAAGTKSSSLVASIMKKIISSPIGFRSTSNLIGSSSLRNEVLADAVGDANDDLIFHSAPSSPLQKYHSEADIPAHNEQDPFVLNLPPRGVSILNTVQQRSQKRETFESVFQQQITEELLVLSQDQSGDDHDNHQKAKSDEELVASQTQFVSQDLMPSQPLFSQVESQKIASALNEKKDVKYSYAWSLATQKGYKYSDEYTRQRRVDIHAEMEDMHYPSFNDCPNHIHAITGKPFQLFMIADGHGGHACAQEAIAKIPFAVTALVHRKAWDFSIPEQQQEFRQKVQRIFLDFDEDYCQRKLSQFKDWLQMALRENGNPFEPRYKKLKPSDDGCTLVVNLIYGGFLINANVGDSRSLLMKQNMNKQQQAAIPCSAPQIKTEQDFRILNNIGAYAARYQNRWFPYFASEDHNTSHIRNATRIHQNGGRFILNGETHRVHDLFDQNVDAMNICNVTSSWPRSFAETRFSVDESKFSRLSRCRIGRPVGWKISELNFPSCTTLNLTGTAGDLFFKYDPPLITACPDVEFIELKLESESYLMVMATDGLWDHMVSQSSQIQNNLISDHASEVLADYDAKNFLFGNFNTASSSLASDMDSSKTLGPSDDLVSSSELDMSILQQSQDEDETQLKLQKLGALAHSLADREMIDNENGLYARGFIRYDDVTVFVVLLEKDTHSDDY